MRKRRADSGFTLIEILIALAVAGGSLVLVLSAHAAARRRSVESRLAMRLERAVESRLAAWKAGIDPSREGPLPGFDRHRWELRVSADPQAGVRRLARVTLAVRDPDGALVLKRSELLQGAR